MTYQFTVGIPDELAGKLKECINKSRKSRNAIVKEALEKYIVEQEDGDSE